MDRTSILGDTIDYVKELLDKIHKMQEEDMDLNTSQMKLTRNLKDLNPNETLVKNPPKVWFSLFFDLAEIQIKP